MTEKPLVADFPAEALPGSSGDVVDELAVGDLAGVGDDVGVYVSAVTERLRWPTISGLVRATSHGTSCH